jgi:hypothetical protein
MTKLNIGLLFLLLAVVFSCKKKDDESVLGLDVQPENDLVGVTISDTSSVFMHTQKVDAVRSYNDQYKYLGSNQDPIFGRTDASIYTNFSIANNLTNVSFGIKPVLDSAEIVLRFLGQFSGDTSTVLTFDVYTLNEKLTSDSLYKTNSSVSKSNSKVSTLNGRMGYRGSNACLILPLDKNFAQYIIQTNSNLTNNTSFLNAYKGFYITTANTSLGIPGSGAIYRVDLDDNISGINMYYHDGNSLSSKGETFKFTFRGVDALRFNHISHNYSAAYHNLFDQITGSGTTDTLKGSSNVYLNCFGGTRAKVYFPYLKNFSDSQVVSISRAELTIKIDEILSPYSLNYGYPANLALLACGTDGSEELVYDQLESSDFVKYGGNYSSTNQLYTFNIARQMQKIVTGKIANYGFYLVNANPTKSIVVRRDNRMERVVLGGKNNPNYKAVFKVTYIKYPYDK